MKGRRDRLIADNKVIQEMITTEKSYNAALALLENVLNIDDFVNNDLLLKEFKQQVSALKNISDGLLTNVEQAIVVEITDTERNSLRTQRTQLLKAWLINPMLNSMINLHLQEKPTQYNTVN